jgi:hypothetical protein
MCRCHDDEAEGKIEVVQSYSISPRERSAWVDLQPPTGKAEAAASA